VGRGKLRSRRPWIWIDGGERDQHPGCEVSGISRATPGLEDMGSSRDGYVSGVRLSYGPGYEAERHSLCMGLAEWIGEQYKLVSQVIKERLFECLALFVIVAATHGILQSSHARLFARRHQNASSTRVEAAILIQQASNLILVSEAMR